MGEICPGAIPELIHHASTRVFREGKLHGLTSMVYVLTPDHCSSINRTTVTAQLRSIPSRASSTLDLTTNVMHHTRKLATPLD